MLIIKKLGHIILKACVKKIRTEKKRIVINITKHHHV